MKIFDRERNAGESAVEWAVATGRIHARDSDEWAEMGAVGERILARIAAGCAVPVTPSGVPHPVAGPEARTSATAPAISIPHGVDPGWYAANPLLDALRAQQPGTVRTATAHNPDVPSLFDSGDLPPFCASGIDPNLLANVPWTVRHAIAETTDRAKALDILQYASGEHAMDAAMEYRDDPANRNYVRRVEGWAANGTTAADAQRYQRDYAARAAAKAAPGSVPVDQMNGDQLYDAVFGDIERQEDEKVDRLRGQVAKGAVVGNFGWNGGVKSTERPR